VSTSASKTGGRVVDDHKPVAIGQVPAPMPAQGLPPVRALYRVAEAVVLLNLSRSRVYELIRAGRLKTVTEGRSRLIPATAITEYVELLIREAGGGDDGQAA
jgi:excisionase family DNA binding protein